VLIIVGVFAYSRGWLSWNISLARPRSAGKDSAGEKLEPVFDGDDDLADDVDEYAPDSLTEDIAQEEAPEGVVQMPTLSGDSLVVTVRIMPEPGEQFPAEKLILTLRESGLKHGKFGIFHSISNEGAERIRYSVASLVEPGSFDLTKLKDSSYRGISVFMVLPAPEDGLELFDEMLLTSRAIAREMDGRLVDEQGGALSVQRERYMREEVIDFLRRHNQPQNHLAS